MEKMQGTENRFLLKQINPALAQDRNFIENLEGTDLNSVVTGQKFVKNIKRLMLQEKELSGFGNERIGGNDADEVDYQYADINYWDSLKLNEQRMLDLLENPFGLSSFRFIQRAIINAILAKRDVFAVMPTGSGKSLLYQLPSLMSTGFTLVILPTISLCIDQGRALEKLNIPVRYSYDRSSPEYEKLYFGLKNYAKFSRDQIERLEQLSKSIKVVLMTPERLTENKWIRESLIQSHNKGLLQRVIIDEAHCVSQWGYEFRFRYLEMKLKEIFNGVQIVAFTATASKFFKENTMKILKMQDVLFFETGYNRPNLRYSIIKKHQVPESAQRQLREIILQQFPNETGIVYCSTRKETEEIAKMLKKNQINALPFHAEIKEKVENFQKWLKNECKVMVATIALGMGIDKPDVRFVVHYSTPSSIERFNQEAGRAGRDRNMAECIVLYKRDDFSTYNFLHQCSKNLRKNKTEQLKPLQQEGEEESEIGEDIKNWTISIALQEELEVVFQASINGIKRFCEEKIVCRRRQQFAFFGQEFDAKDCGKLCDNCERSFQYKVYDLILPFKNILSFICLRDSHSIKIRPKFLAYVLGRQNQAPLAETVDHGDTNDYNDEKNLESSKYGVCGVMKDVHPLVIEKFVDAFMFSHFVTIERIDLRQLGKIDEKNRFDRMHTVKLEQHQIKAAQEVLDKKKNPNLSFIIRQPLVEEFDPDSEPLRFQRMHPSTRLAKYKEDLNPKLIDMFEDEKPVELLDEFRRDSRSAQDKYSAKNELPARGNQSLDETGRRFNPQPSLEQYSNPKSHFKLYGYCRTKELYEEIHAKLRWAFQVINLNEATQSKLLIDEELETELCKYLPTSKAEHATIGGYRERPDFERLLATAYETIGFFVRIHKIDKRFRDDSCSHAEQDSSVPTKVLKRTRPNRP